MGKKKPQGKINHKIVIAGLLAGKKKKDIAVEAGSLAKGDAAKCDAVTDVTKSPEFKKESRPFIEELIKERARMIKGMRLYKFGRFSQVEYRDLTAGVDKFTKNIQLLSGKPTGREEVMLPAEEKKEIVKALSDL